MMITDLLVLVVVFYAIAACAAIVIAVSLCRAAAQADTAIKDEGDPKC